VLWITPVHSPAIKIPRLEIRCNSITHQLSTGVARLHVDIAVKVILLHTCCNREQHAALPLSDLGIQTNSDLRASADIYCKKPMSACESLGEPLRGFLQFVFS